MESPLKKYISFEVSAGALLYHEKQQKREYLLLRYPHGHWEFPRGHREGEETLEETAKREVEEETAITGITLEKDFEECFSFWYKAKGNEKKKRLQQGKGLIIFKRVHFFLAQAPSSETTLSHEHSGFKWMSYEQALKRLTYDNAKTVITKAEEFLQKK